mgnify:CR=1 FL=1
MWWFSDMSTQKTEKIFVKNVVVLRYVNMENGNYIVKNVEVEIRSRVIFGSRSGNQKK